MPLLQPIHKLINVYVFDFWEIVFVQLVEMIVVTYDVGCTNSNRTVNKLIVVGVLLSNWYQGQFYSLLIRCSDVRIEDFFHNLVV